MLAGCELGWYIVGSCPTGKNSGQGDKAFSSIRIGNPVSVRSLFLTTRTLITVWKTANIAYDHLFWWNRTAEERHYITNTIPFYRLSVYYWKLSVTCTISRVGKRDRKMEEWQATDLAKGIDPLWEFLLYVHEPYRFYLYNFFLFIFPIWKVGLRNIIGFRLYGPFFFFFFNKILLNIRLKELLLWTLSATYKRKVVNNRENERILIIRILIMGMCHKFL